MAPKIVFVFIIQALIFKASSQMQPSLKQYIFTAPQQQLPSTQSAVPSQTKPANSLSALASLASLLTSAVSPALQSAVTSPPANHLVTTQPSNHFVTTQPANHLVTTQPANHLVTTQPANHLVTSTPAHHIVNTPTNHVHCSPMLAPEKPSSGVDMELLNNLAIALQLMIVNNILSTPPTDNPNQIQTAALETEKQVPQFEAVENLSYMPIQNDLPVGANQYQSYQPNAYEHQHLNQMPNANFVGSSGFSTNPFMGSVPPPSPSRSGLTLMSPYEALSPSSPYMDPIISSPYGSVISSKKDFQSPYAAILGSDKDYFSMSSINDLF